MASRPSTPSQAQPDLTASELQDLPDIRMLPAEERHTLSDGDMVKIYRGRGIQPHNFICEIPVKLLKVASVTSSKLLSNIQDGIHLPRDVDPDAVLDFLQYIFYVVKTKDDPQPMELKYDLYLDLSVSAASWLLGMQYYTAHIYHFYWSYWNETIPAYSEVTFISNLPFWMDKHDNLFNKIARGLAELVREGYVPDPEVFQAYLENENPRMRDAITEINKAHAERADRIARAAAQVERVRKAAEATREQKEYEDTVSKKKQEAHLRAKEKFAALKARDTALEQSIKEKMKKAGQMFTPDEKQHWIRTRGSRPPKGR